jgi:hypothetical protein
MIRKLKLISIHGSLTQIRAYQIYGRAKIDLLQARLLGAA